MGYVVQAVRLNRTVIVQVQVGGEERTVRIRNQETAYSDVITRDMTTQKQFRYITCKFIDTPEDSTVPDAGQGALISAVDQHEAEMRGEANPPPSELVGEEVSVDEDESIEEEETPPVDEVDNELTEVLTSEDESEPPKDEAVQPKELYSEAELKKMTVAKLRKILETYPNIKVDPKLRKGKLLKALLEYDILKVKDL